MATLFADTPGDFGRQLNARRAQQGQMFDQNAQNQARFAFEAQRAKQDQLNRNASAFAAALQAKALQVDKSANREFQLEQAKTAADRRDTQFAESVKASADRADMAASNSLLDTAAKSGLSVPQGSSDQDIRGIISAAAQRSNQSYQDQQFQKKVEDWRVDRYKYLKDYSSNIFANEDRSPSPAEIRVAETIFNRIRPYPTLLGGQGTQAPVTQAPVTQAPVTPVTPTDTSVVIGQPSGTATAAAALLARRFNRPPEPLSERARRQFNEERERARAQLPPYVDPSDIPLVAIPGLGM